MLGAILVLSAALNVYQLNSIGLGNTYYAAAVKSMLQSWHNFFFVSFDPGGFVTIDKPPLAFWLQTISAKLFGFSGLSLLLPQAIAGVLSVALLYHLVARVFGRGAGLLAALALAISPVAVVVDRSNLAESTLVLSLLLAAWATSKASETGRLRWLLLGAALVGIGFNIKMLEAYLALPALLLMYLVGAPIRWPARIWHTALAVVVLLAVSLSWVAAVDLTPASQRPYVASSGDNSELSLALGYNGLGRLTGNLFSFSHGASLSNTLSDLSPTNLGFTQGETGSPGIQRLLNAELGGQTSWLLLLAVIGFIVGAWQRRPRWPLDPPHQALVLWGAWLATGAAFFSVAGFFHAYYLATIAPPIAALAGIGLATLWHDYRHPGWRGWTLPIALVATALGQAYILGNFPDWSRWLTPLVVGATLVLAAFLTVLRLGWRLPGSFHALHERRPRAERADEVEDGVGVRPIALAALALGVVALMLPSFVWSEYTVAHASAGMVPSAGPGGRGGPGFGGGRRFAGGSGFFFPGDAGSRRGDPGFGPIPGEGFAPAGGRGFPPGGPAGGPGGFGRDQTAVNPQLVRYLEVHQGHATFLVATLNAGQAEPFILSTGKPVMDLGGFMGGDHILSVSQLAADVSKGVVRYFLVAGRGPDRFGRLPRQLRRRFERRGGFRRFGGFGAARDANAGLMTWVSSHCRAVSASAYGSTGSPIGGFDFGGNQPLYDCGSYASSHPPA